MSCKAAVAAAALNRAPGSSSARTVHERDLLFTDDVKIAGQKGTIEIAATKEHGWLVKARSLDKMFDCAVREARKYASPSEMLVHTGVDGTGQDKFAMLTAAGVERLLREHSTPKRVAWMNTLLPLMQRQVVPDWSPYSLAEMRTWIADYDTYECAAEDLSTTRAELEKLVKGKLWIPTRAEMDEQVRYNSDFINLEKADKNMLEMPREKKESAAAAAAPKEESSRKRVHSATASSGGEQLRAEPKAAMAAAAAAASKPKIAATAEEEKEEPSAKKARQMPEGFLTAHEARALAHEDRVAALLALAMTERARVLPKQVYTISVAGYGKEDVAEFVSVMKGVLYKVEPVSEQDILIEY
jgi:hypothetical protein